MHNNQNKTNQSVTLGGITLRTAYFCKLGNITKRGGGGCSVAHIADDIQKQNILSAIYLVLEYCLTAQIKQIKVLP